MEQEFEWDRQKALANRRKHKISFDEAITVFNDPLEITISDPDHSTEEARFVTLGESADGKLLVISHTARLGKIRIISCRKATASERKKYEEES